MLKTVIMFAGIGIGVFLGLRNSLRDIASLMKSKTEEHGKERENETSIAKIANAKPEEVTEDEEV